MKTALDREAVGHTLPLAQPLTCGSALASPPAGSPLFSCVPCLLSQALSTGSSSVTYKRSQVSPALEGE